MLDIANFDKKFNTDCKFTVCLIVFHYLYQYDAVKLFYNWFAFNREFQKFVDFETV